MRRKKTKLMIEVEQRLGAPLEQSLPPLLNKKGLTNTAIELGVSKATLCYWLLKLDMESRYSLPEKATER